MSVDRRLIVAGIDWPPETFLARLFSGLVERGWQISVAAPRRPNAIAGVNPGWIRTPASGPRVVRLLQTVAVLAGAASRCGTAILPLLRYTPRHHWPQVLPLAGHGGLLYLPWIAAAVPLLPLLRTGRPYVVSCRGTQVQVAPWMPSRTGLRAGLPEVFSRAAAVHCVSEAICREAVALGLDQDAAVVIRPAVGVPPAQRKPDPARRPTVVSVGALRWIKGYEYALRAVAELVDEFPDLRYRIAGDGPERDRLQYTIADLDLTANVELWGDIPAPSVNDLLSESDLFLHTSLSEGISNAVLEAMAAGVPVVCSDVGGMAEAITDGREGRLVPARDPRAAANAMATILRDPELGERMGQAARDRVERDFALDAQVHAMDALFTQALREDRLGASS